MTAVARLDEVAELNPRLKDRPEDGTVVSFLGMADVNTDGSTAEGVDRRFGDTAKGYTQFRRGDVLVAKITPCFENGKIAQASTRHLLAAGSTEFHVVRPNLAVLDGRYLHHYLRQPLIKIEGERRMTGSAGQQRVPEAYLAQLKIPLPPLDEQQRIATRLDQAEKLRSKRRQATSLLDDLAQSIFHDMFGDPVINSRSWPQRSIGEIGRVITGNTPSRSDPENFGNYIEWIKSDNIDPQFTVLTRATESLSAQGATLGRKVPSRAVLVTCIAGTPASIGNVAVADRDVAFNQQINALTSHDMEIEFLYMLLRISKPLVQAQSTGGMKGLVSKSRFESIILISPPRQLQREFSQRFQVLEKVRALHRAHMDSLDALFSTLQAKAFSGEL
jgi:type I restriction enzyme S subunit